MDENTEKDPDREMSEFNFVLIALAIVFITMIILFILKKRKPRTDLVMLGLCDSGKTLLYSLLIQGEETETFTSIVENVGQFRTKKGSIKVVDIPGHERLRVKFLDQYKLSTKALCYVVDSATIQKDIRDVADFLYTILADKAFSGLSVLILCNKQDETFAKSQSVVESLLEKEMNVIRKTRASQLESVDNSSTEIVFLGKQDKDFSFAHINNKIQFAEASAKNKNYESLTKWIQAL